MGAETIHFNGHINYTLIKKRGVGGCQDPQIVINIFKYYDKKHKNKVEQLIDLRQS